MIRFNLQTTFRRIPGISRVVSSAKHGGEFAATLLTAGFTSVTPQRLDPILCSAIHKTFVRLRPSQVDLIASRIERCTRTATEPPPVTLSDSAMGYWRMRIEVWFGEARGAGLRPWKPSVVVEGAEHVDRALELGHGAILWRMSFTSATVVNWGLKQAGYDIVHLSSDAHRGGTRSWFAEHFSAPLYIRSEARLVAKRIIRPRTGNLAYLKDLRGEVNKNSVVTIVGDITNALHTETHRVGDLKLKIPTGAPSLAYSSGASLHTCVALREGPYRYRLVIGPDIVEARVGPKPGARRAATTRYASELEHRMEMAPESSRFWGKR